MCTYGGVNGTEEEDLVAIWMRVDEGKIIGDIHTNS